MRLFLRAVSVSLFLMFASIGAIHAQSGAETNTIALASQGDARAEYELGQMYQGGRGVPQDIVKALEWYRKSADQGFAPAEVAMGGMYRGYAGLPRDDAEAVRWYQKAASQGNLTAKIALASEPFTRNVRKLPEAYRTAAFIAIVATSCATMLSIYILLVMVSVKVTTRAIAGLHLPWRKAFHAGLACTVLAVAPLIGCLSSSRILLTIGVLSYVLSGQIFGKRIKDQHHIPLGSFKITLIAVISFAVPLVVLAVCGWVI